VSVAYRLMYLLGFAPWDRMLPSELHDVISGPDALQPGRALDMGSGMGTKAVYMASHGWQVTAFEAVPRAMAEARRRAAKAGVKVDFRIGDVTRLDTLDLKPGYDLVFDFGCFHGLNQRQGDAYAKGASSVAAQGATLLVMAFTKAVPPVMRGVTEAELRERFPGWDLKWSHPVEHGGTSAMSRGSAAWFSLIKS
jgi:cyclopropane fatty-acyl-phospholipid synthase-like methyltransferase